ncbi:hypothetical protein CAPTEDRAFT_154022 [Capitella teleta]|uniref:Ras guanyl-releasing protein 3 n=1 Tax=Capitella teleta TaxID=283909 RepID=R7U0T8_CAPTE|nr:hypothetical protein CAPTEDRAFT_154022 [Capitella teleta]|eukprot:ELT99497.1 hypothetical protein CAPTEDRAFT_154022 [Capitella teleta]
MYFDLNTALSQAVFHLQEVIRSEQPDSHLAALIDISLVPSFDWMRNMSVRNPPSKNSTSSSPRVNLVFNMLKPSELAEQLTYMEYKAFRRIRFEDFKHYATHASLKDNPRLERSVALFNGLSQWIQCMVLSKTTPQQRADVIVKFVNVAMRLREIQNYNTLMAVVGGLTHSSLARLSKTNACLPSDTQKVLMDFTELVSSSNNFSTYRKSLHQSEGFRIPILGVHLKDLILLNTALGDKVEGELINFRKMVQLSLTFSQLMQVATSSLPVEVNMDLVNTIRLSLDLHYTEDEIYELSLAREPRNSLSSPSTPTKPVVFADWVAGISPPDADTINKHVHDMVEAVFKNYDHDKDGFISHAEFELIAGNFPFIDSFAVLDADQDGMISRAEMKTYFIRANCHALRRCFKHNFHELTYFKPTFCIHCTGLLWGLIKQGWKCKDCGINAHKHCKDLVVMECRSKSYSIHGRSMSNGHRDVTIASKRKMSQRHKRQRASRATQTIESGLSSRTSSPLVTVRSSASQENELTLAEVEVEETPPPLAASGGTIEEEPPQRSDSNEKVDQEYYEDSDTVFERLTQDPDEEHTPYENRDKLLSENHILRSRVVEQSDQIHTLRSHIGVIRQQTVTFILNQMDTLHMQRDTEV